MQKVVLVRVRIVATASFPGGANLSWSERGDASDVQAGERGPVLRFAYSTLVYRRGPSGRLGRKWNRGTSSFAARATLRSEEGL